MPPAAAKALDAHLLRLLLDAGAGVKEAREYSDSVLSQRLVVEMGIQNIRRVVTPPSVSVR